MTKRIRSINCLMLLPLLFGAAAASAAVFGAKRWEFNKAEYCGQDHGMPNTFIRASF